MTSAEITAFLSEYVDGQTAEKISQMIYNTMGDVEAGIPTGGVVKDFNDAVLGPQVKNDIVKLSLLIQGYLDATTDAIETIEDDAEFISALDAVASVAEGDISFTGDVYANGNKKLATEEYVDEKAEEMETAVSQARGDTASFYGKLIDVEWERGSINGTDGQPNTPTGSPWIRTPENGYIALDGAMAIATANNPKRMYTRVFYYAYSGGVYNFITSEARTLMPHVIMPPEGATHIKLIATTEDYNSTGGGINPDNMAFYSQKVWLAYANNAAYKQLTEISHPLFSAVASVHGTVIPLSWESGHINYNTGELADNDKRLRSTDYIPYSTDYLLLNNTVDEDNKLQGFVCLYAEDETYIPITPAQEWTNLQVRQLDMSVYKDYNPAKFKIVIRDSRDVAITPGITQTIQNNIALVDTAQKKDDEKNTITDVLYDVFGADYDDIETAYSTGYYWNSQTDNAVKTSYSGFAAYNPIPVLAGDVYSVDVYCADSTKQNPVLLVSDSGSTYPIIKSYRGANGTINHFDIPIPAGAAYLLVTTYAVKTGDTQVKKKKVRTKATNRIWDGKTIAIIGDSISTNGNSGTDANVPEIKITEDDVGVELSAYLTDKDVDGGLSIAGHDYVASEIGTEVTFTPTDADVGKVIGLPLNYNSNTVTTWWENVKAELGGNYIPVCWSGSSITSHEGTTNAYKASYAWHDSQIRKCGVRTPGSMARTAPDVIIIYRGTNDFSHSPYAKLTENYFDSVAWEYPVSDLLAEGYGYKEGLSLTISKLRAAYPNAKIFLCTLNVFKRINYAHFPTNNGTNTLPQYNNAIREVADFMGCGLIEFDKDGITFENCYSGGYVTDSATTPTHPSNKGHAVMGRKAIADILAQWNDM